MIIDILDAFGIATGGAADYEADDVLGTLAASEYADPVIVVSGDRDLLQVVADHPVCVQVLYLGRGLAQAKLWGPVEVAERYGLPVERAGAAYAELALLRGDPADGLPGVPGIGEKTAGALLAQHGSLAAILTAAADPHAAMSNRIRARLRGAADYIRVAEPVVRVITDAPVALSTASDVLPHAAADPGRVDELADQLGIGSSIARLTKALDHLGRPTS